MLLPEILQSLMLRQIKLTPSTEEKPLIEGKLNNVFFTSENNGFGIELTIQMDHKNRIFKLPFPFKWENHEEDCLLYLDYRLTSLFNKPRWTNLTLDIFDELSKENPPGKLFNNILEIHYR